MYQEISGVTGKFGLGVNTERVPFETGIIKVLVERLSLWNVLAAS